MRKLVTCRKWETIKIIELLSICFVLNTSTNKNWIFSLKKMTRYTQHIHSMHTMYTQHIHTAYSEYPIRVCSLCVRCVYTLCCVYAVCMLRVCCVYTNMAKHSLKGLLKHSFIGLMIRIFPNRTQQTNTP